MGQSVSTVSENTEEARRLALENLRETVSVDFLGSEAVYQSLKSLVSAEEYASIRTEYVRGWFWDNLAPEFLQPSGEQLEIIANSTGNTLVTARAGSGKTTLSVYRALFLIAALGVPPRTILMLAFNRSAVLELRERMFRLLVTRETWDGYIYEAGPLDERSRESVLNRWVVTACTVLPVISTFHRLAYTLVRPDKRQFSIGSSDDSAGLNKDALCHAIESAISSSDETIAGFISASGIKGGDEETVNSGEGGKKNFDRATLKDERAPYVAAKEALDWLFMHGIEYIMDPDGGAVLARLKNEHEEDLGIIFNEVPGLPPQVPFFIIERRKKVDFDEEKWLRFIEKSVGKVPPQLSDQDIWLRSVKVRNHYFDVLTFFFTVCRQKRIMPDELDEMAEDYEPLSDKEGAVVGIAAQIYRWYCEELERNRLYDFEKLFTETEKLVEDHSFPSVERFRFIEIDEFQDFSQSYYDLIKSITDVSQARIFAVGDDWQAINSFAGSDLKFFRNFSSYFEGGTVRFLTINYRSGKKIVQAGNLLMKGLGKEARAADGAGDGRVVLQAGSTVSQFLKLQIVPTVKGIAEKLREQYPDESIAVLTRTTAELAAYAKTARKLNLILSTVHKFKGLEADNVILNVSEWCYPLIHPDWIYNRILGTSVRTITDEDRRLLYVGMTRARKRLYLLAGGIDDISPFIDDSGIEEISELLGRNEMNGWSAAAGAVFVLIAGDTYPHIDEFHRWKFRFEPSMKSWLRTFPDLRAFNDFIRLSGWLRDPDIAVLSADSMERIEELYLRWLRSGASQKGSEKTGSGKRSPYRKKEETDIEKAASGRLDLKRAYEILHASTSDGDGTVKKAYRREANKHHPDKLRAKGLSEKMLKEETAKFELCNAAWEVIRAARGIR